MTDAFQLLEEEHQFISRVLDALAHAVQRDLPLAYYAEAVRFLADFADGWHHAKEEAILFRYLEEHGMPRDYGPLGVLLSEHDYGREQLASVSDAVAAGTRGDVLKPLESYVALLREHIHKEDHVLYPMGRALLTPQEIEAMGVEFDAVPEPKPTLAALREMGERLITEAGVSV